MIIQFRNMGCYSVDIEVRRNRIVFNNEIVNDEEVLSLAQLKA